MGTKHQRIYLASQSPRRRELLKQIGVNYEMLLLRNDPRRNMHVDETPVGGEDPVEYVQRICRDKALAGWKTLGLRDLPLRRCWPPIPPLRWTGRIIGKPGDRENAAEILR